MSKPSFFSKLFPKGISRDETLARLKMLTHKLNQITKEYDKKGISFKKKAEAFYKQGNLANSKVMLMRSKDMERKSLKFTNLLIKLDHYSSMIQEGKINAEITSTFGLVADQLEKDVKLMNPEKAIETDERIKYSAMQMEQASELMGGDLEADLGIDMDDVFAEFEAELAAKAAGKLADVPETADEVTVSVLDDDDDLEGVKDKDQIMKEMEKLKKELG